jgi:hypothetical protein
LFARALTLTLAERTRFVLQLILLAMAAYVLWCGVRGILGKPDPGQSKGRTSLPVAIACIVVAIGIAIFALVGLPLM